MDAVDTFVIEGEGIFEPMHELLEKFQNRKILVSGADDEQFIEFGLDKVPYEVFTLKHNPEKTDTKYFSTLLEYFNLKSEEVIYFEHNPEAVKSAEKIGIKSYYYDPSKQDLDSLETFIRGNI